MKYILDFKEYINEAFNIPKKETVADTIQKIGIKTYPDYYKGLFNFVDANNYIEIVKLLLQNTDFKESDFAIFYQKNGGKNVKKAIFYFERFGKSLAIWEKLYTGKDLYSLLMADIQENSIDSMFSLMDSFVEKDTDNDGNYVDYDDVLMFISALYQDPENPDPSDTTGMTCIDYLMLQQYAEKANKINVLNVFIQGVKAILGNESNDLKVEGILDKLELILNLSASEKKTIKTADGKRATTGEKWQGTVEFTYQTKEDKVNNKTQTHILKGTAKQIIIQFVDIVGINTFNKSVPYISNKKYQITKDKKLEITLNPDSRATKSNIGAIDELKMLASTSKQIGVKTLSIKPPFANPATAKTLDSFIKKLGF